MGKLLTPETRSYLRLVFTTFVVLAAIAAFNILIIINSVGSNVFQPIQRNLAAVTHVEQVKPKRIFSPIIEINCQKKNEKIQLSTLATSARFVFKNCEKVGRLVNESNHNQGDIFPIKNRFWTSDYISLDPGQNIISAPLGKQTQKIEINRKVAKKKSLDKAL